MWRHGTFDPRAPYGGYTQTALTHVPTGLRGLLFDPTFGALTTAPVLALAVIGFVRLAAPRKGAPDARQRSGVRKDARLAGELAIVIASYLAVVAMYRMWWGGWSGPARFMAPVLLTLAIPLAVFWADVRTRTVRFVAVLLLAMTVAISLVHVGADEGRLAYGERTRSARWLAWTLGARPDLQDVPQWCYGDILALVHEGEAYPEANGIWVGAGRDVVLVFRRDAVESTFQLKIVNVPVANRIVLESENHSVGRPFRGAYTLSAREEQVVELPWPTGARELLVTIRTDAGVRPRDLDPQSTDARLLGCWIEIFPAPSS